MTTASDAYTAIKNRLTGNKPAGITAYRWQNLFEDSNGNVNLPDEAASFAYVEMLTEPSAIAAFGGGRGQNIYRNPFRIMIYVFVPRGTGLKEATDLAEQLAALFRSYRDGTISCAEATVFPGGDGAQFTPPGMNSAADNYFWASAEASGFFDQIG